MTIREDKPEESMSLEKRRAFLKLPLAERRKMLADQAEQMVAHYEQESEKRERDLWQGGDIVQHYIV